MNENFKSNSLLSPCKVDKVGGQKSPFRIKYTSDEHCYSKELKRVWVTIIP